MKMKIEEIQRPLETGDLHAKCKTGESSCSKRSQKNAPTWAVGPTECYQDCNEGRETELTWIEETTPS